MHHFRCWYVCATRWVEHFKFWSKFLDLHQVCQWCSKRWAKTKWVISSGVACTCWGTPGEGTSFTTLPTFVCTSFWQVSGHAVQAHICKPLGPLSMDNVMISPFVMPVSDTWIALSPKPRFNCMWVWAPLGPFGLANVMIWNLWRIPHLRQSEVWPTPRSYIGFPTLRHI